MTSIRHLFDRIYPPLTVEVGSQTHTVRGRSEASRALKMEALLTREYQPPRKSR